MRQIFYRLVGAHGYDKTEQAYARLGEHLNRARRDGRIQFDAIRDDGITLREPWAWDSADELITSFVDHAQRFRLDRQNGQPARLIFAVEAAGMLPQVQSVADPVRNRGPQLGWIRQPHSQVPSGHPSGPVAACRGPAHR